MYFWNVKKLASDLKANKVSEAEKMKYLTANTLAWMLGVFFVELSPVPVWNKPLFFTCEIAMLVLIIVGIMVCYRANAEGDGKDFLGRFMSLSWPIQIRLFVVIILIMVASVAIVTPAIEIAFGPLTEDTLQSLDDISRLIGVALLAVQYLWTRKYIKAASVKA